MVEIENLWIEYQLEGGGMHTAVRDVSLSIDAGEFFTLLGPSGCGKTSTLRSIAGLEQPTRGRITVDGSVVYDAARGVNVATHQRDVAMVFQSYAIWPHLSVAENVAFPLEVAKVPAKERARRVGEALELVGLHAIGDRSATQLSGGQQQRVAIARGIVRGSPVVLLDEPLSNLDAKLREQMRAELRELLKRVGVTALYVTHDQEEALTLSDRIAVMDGGRVVEVGTPEELYLRPATRFAAAFLGQAELFDVRGCVETADGHEVETDIGPVRVQGAARPASRATHLVIRPEAIRLHREPVALGNTRAGRVVAATFAGRHVAYVVRLASGRDLSVVAVPFGRLAVGTDVTVELPPERLICVGEAA
jgi:iron(III) transport system ATP-binding protein